MSECALVRCRHVHSTFNSVCPSSSSIAHGTCFVRHSRQCDKIAQSAECQKPTSPSQTATQPALATATNASIDSIHSTHPASSSTTMSIIHKKTVLITGCSAGGIGHAVAKNFQQRGYHVFATLRDLSKAADLADLENVDIIELDVTKPDSITRCKERVAHVTGGTLDILFNNAGVEFIKPLLDQDLTEARELFDVNVWGLLAVTQAFAPLVIESRGIIINQSSIDAVINPVFAGIFSASKAAVTRLSEVLRCELEPLGVRVVTVMSGSADTPMFTKPGSQMHLPETSYYYNTQAQSYKERMDFQSKAWKVDVLAESIVKSVLAGVRYPIWPGSFGFLVRILTWIAPISLVDGLINPERGINMVKRL
ncbi:hypothetical protein MRB53_040180 [Persea americana]|nr:hypothetical protein MRB53_040180 [Persea americana]